MNQTNQMVDDGLVDMETGEVLGPYELDKTAVIEDLPKYARTIRAGDNRIAMIEKYRTEEVERIKAICDAKIDKLKLTRRFFAEIAERLMKTAGKKRLEYPGLGTFRFGVSLKSVNTEEYDDMPDDMQTSLQSTHHGWFRKKITVAPDKKKITVALEGGEEILGFSLNRPHETFTFKAEK